MNRPVRYSPEAHRVLNLIRHRRPVSISDRPVALALEYDGAVRWSPGPVSFELTPEGAVALQAFDFRGREAAKRAAAPAAEAHP